MSNHDPNNPVGDGTKSPLKQDSPINSNDQQPSSAPRPVMVQTPTQHPVVTYVLMGLTILMFILQNLSKLQFNADIVLAIFAKMNPLIVNGEYWRLFTPALVHGNLLHLGFNMYALFILGRSVEAVFGHWRFLMLYIVGAFGGNVFSFAFSEAVSVGASTSIFAIIGAQAVFIIKNRHIFGERTRSMILQIAFILILNFAISVMPNSSIDLWSHLGGFVAGTVFSVLAAPSFKLTNREGRLVLEDSSEKADRYLAFLMVMLAFSVILYFAIRWTASQ